MLSPVTLPNDVKSIEFRLGALLKELAVISNQTPEVQNSILPNDVKSIEFKLGALVEELAVISNQTSEVQNSIANLKNGTHFIKKTLAETKYSVQVVDYQLKELTDPIVAMQANLRSILRIIRLVSIAVLVGVALVADSYFNWIEQFMVFSGKFSD